ncbi:MAG: PilZ domain-containing protein [Nitrospiraceae bacterium]|nr:PilZ domain-containing protein [Nitrospiraceae bacterium]
MATGGIAHERRRHKRDLTTVPMSYTAFPPEGAGPQKGEATNGITLNVSDTGICFYTQCLIEEGVSVVITSNAIWDEPKRGTIKWCRKITDELYRVGVILSD